jgi:hypothetical protein
VWGPEREWEHVLTWEVKDDGGDLRAFPITQSNDWRGSRGTLRDLTHIRPVDREAILGAGGMAQL